MKRVLFCLIVIIFSCNRVYASECSNEDRARLQKLASNISYIIEEYPNNGESQFKLIFTGVSKELRLFSEQKFASFYNFTDNDFGETEVPGLNNGKTYTFNIYGRNSCEFNTLREITINIPKYNQYYSDSLCENAKEYKFCQKWFDSSEMSYEDFKNKVNKYIKQKQIKPSSNPNIENNKSGFNFFEIYDKYYWPTLIGVICLLILLIILWLKQNKKNKL